MRRRGRRSLSNWEKSGARVINMEVTKRTGFASKESKFSFEPLEFNVLMRHLYANVQKALGNFSKSFTYFHREVSNWPVKTNEIEIKEVNTSRGNNFQNLKSGIQSDIKLKSYRGRYES